MFCYATYRYSCNFQMGGMRSWTNCFFLEHVFSSEKEKQKMLTQTTENLKSKIIDSSWAHRPSIKGTKPLFIVIKAIIFISKIILKESIFLQSNLKRRICRVTIPWIPGTYVPHSSNIYTEDVDDWIFHSLSNYLSPFSVYCFSALWLFVPWWWCGWGVMFTFCPEKNPPQERKERPLLRVDLNPLKQKATSS